MISLPVQIILAFALDAIFGDPRWLPHPVQGIAKLALFLEISTRRLISGERLAGLVATTLVVALTALSCSLLLFGARVLHPLLGDVIAVLILYSSLAARDLGRHAIAVKHALDCNDIVAARQKVSMLVGRDTDQLDETAIARATVESVAENTVDAVTAPLCFALLGGPTGAMIYKAINTLDSTFGYKNERYLQFGWFPARLDDVANFLPARLTALLTPLAAALNNLDARQAWAIFKRDRMKHPSPNGGQIEAAVAGALRIQLGGETRYFGQASFRPYLGDADEPVCAGHIGIAVRLMWTTSILTAGAGMVVWWCVIFFMSAKELS